MCVCVCVCVCVLEEGRGWRRGGGGIGWERFLQGCRIENSKGVLFLWNIYLLFLCNTHRPDISVQADWAQNIKLFTRNIHL